MYILILAGSIFSTTSLSVPGFFEINCCIVDVKALDALNLESSFISSCKRGDRISGLIGLTFFGVSFLGVNILCICIGEEGREEGREEGEAIGMEKGRIQLLQELLDGPSISQQEMNIMSLEELQSTTKSLQSKLRERNA